MLRWVLVEPRLPQNRTINFSDGNLTFLDRAVRNHNSSPAVEKVQNSVVYSSEGDTQLVDSVMLCMGRMLLLLLLTVPLVLKAQEIKFIDLTLVPQHTELRHPLAPQVACGTGECGGGVGSVSVGCGAPDHRDPHALGVELLHVTPTAINPAEPIEVEFRVLNTGLAPIEIPASPHLSHLQPADESVAFTYRSLALVVRVAGDVTQPLAGSATFVQLYGSPDHPETMLVLTPGKWIRVRAKLKVPEWPLLAARLHGEFWLRRTAFRPRAGGGSVDIDNLYPNSTPTPWLTVRLRPAEPMQTRASW